MLKRSLAIAVVMVLALPWVARADLPPVGVNVDTVGYTGMLNSTITYGDLWAHLGIGSLSDVSNVAVSYKDMLNVTASTLNSRGDPTSVSAATAVGNIALAVPSALTFKFGDIVNFTAGTFGQAGALNVNVLDLVGAAAMAANNDHLLSLDLPLTVPGVSNTHMKMSVIEPPATASGRVGISVHSAAVRIQLSMNLTTTVLVGVTQVPITLKVYTEAAEGDGQLTNIACAPVNTNSQVTIHSTRDGQLLYVGEVPDGALTNKSVRPTVSPATVANVPGLVQITAYASELTAGVTKDSVMTGPFTRTDSVGTTSANSQTLKNNLQITVTSLGGLFNATVVSGAVRAALQPVLDELDTYVLNKMSSEPFGIEFAGADVMNQGVNCAARRLGS
jgi:uncharacterized membrane protein